MGTGRHVRVVEGGTDAWDEAMGTELQPPAAHAGADAWNAYRTKSALRRRFGEKDDAEPSPPVAAPVVPVIAAPTKPKKREGC
jgi:hypothetical protein